MTDKPLILVTNDDGINAVGLDALREALSDLGDVYVVAPDREASAAGHSITLHNLLRINEISDKVVSIEGTPTDCVLIATLKVLPRKPDLIVSGINRGGNMGDDVTYSGTVSAALEGTLLDIPSFAISLVTVDRWDFTTSGEFAARLAGEIFERGLPPTTLLNVNVPDVPREEIAGVRITRQGRRLYQDEIVEKIDPRGRPYYWIGAGEPHWRIEPGTDYYAVSNKYISVTPLHIDMTNHEQIPEIRDWNLAHE
ncbi:5'/3'-nucleotidase SurE [Candidatus Hydrogenedentota bacterium]